ncbi:hypothetical protein SCHPADRAFT_897073 [Schizopora paradoxa]|uniref:Uncharacterized protein n=1 Tax=Schizopora paradoxa TaxID=27342 RepID=A0A0H2QXP0_9AGAM|nr:hypothetical protein SCHPADRAFT_897073 [Schizopora paradoxa]
MADNLPAGAHNFFCFNIPTRAAYDRDPDEPLRQADVKPNFEGQTFSPLPSLAKFSLDFLDAHGDGEYTFNDIYRHASFYEDAAVKKAAKAVFEGPRYQGVPTDETWYCAMYPEQIATLNLTLPPYTEAFWKNQASKLYVKGSLEQLKNALDKRQQGMRNAYAYLDAVVHQVRNLNVPEDMFVVPPEPPVGWKPYRAEGGVKELKAKYHAPPPPIIPSPYEQGVVANAQAPVPAPAPAPTPYVPTEPILLPTTTTIVAPVEPIAPVPSELDYPTTTQPSVVESGPVEYDNSSDLTPSTICAPAQGAIPKLAGKEKERLPDEDSVLELSEPEEEHIDAIDPALLMGALDYRPLTEEKRAEIEKWRMEVAKKGISPEAPEINDGFKAPSMARHLRELYENPPKVPAPPTYIEPVRKLVLKISAPKKDANPDTTEERSSKRNKEKKAEGSSRETKTIPWLSTRIGKRTGGAPKRSAVPETDRSVPEKASPDKSSPLPLPSALKFLNARPTPFVPPPAKELLSFPNIATLTPIQPTPVRTVMAFTGHANFALPAGTPSSHGSMPGLLPVEPIEEKTDDDLPPHKEIDEEKLLAKYHELYEIAINDKMSVDEEKKGSYQIVLPVPPYANENNSDMNAFEYRYVVPNNSDASAHSNLAICASKLEPSGEASSSRPLPDIEDIVPDPLASRRTRRALKRSADGKVIGRLASEERELGRQNLLPRQIKGIPYVPSERESAFLSTKTKDPRRIKRKDTPHPSAPTMPVPTRVIKKDGRFKLKERELDL